MLMSLLLCFLLVTLASFIPTERRSLRPFFGLGTFISSKDKVPMILADYPLSFPCGEGDEFEVIDARLLPRSIRKRIYEDARLRERLGLDNVLASFVHSLKIDQKDDPLLVEKLTNYAIFMFDKLNLQDMEIFYGLKFIHKHFIQMRSSNVYNRTLFFLDRLKAKNFFRYIPDSLIPDSVKDLEILFPILPCQFHEAINSQVSLNNIWYVLVYLIEYQEKTPTDVVAGIFVFVLKHLLSFERAAEFIVNGRERFLTEPVNLEIFKDNLSEIIVHKETLYLFLTKELNLN
jgi:hypothetical protein